MYARRYQCTRELETIQSDGKKYTIQKERKRVGWLLDSRESRTPYLQDTQGQESSGDPREGTAVGVIEELFEDDGDAEDPAAITFIQESQTFEFIS